MNLEHLLSEDQLQLRQTMKDFTKKEIISLLRNGKIIDSKTIAALAFAGVV